MKFTFTITTILLGLLLNVQAQAPARVLEQLAVDVVYLSSDLLKGRETGTEGEAMAAAYIARRFQAIGLEAKGTEGWFQPFEARMSNNPHASTEEKEARKGKNVVGFLDNGAERTVVIGAHYDHLGMGHFGSRHTGEKAIHNGADDNASGTAVLIRLAEVLANSDLTQHNYLFVAFSGEEMGLYGSKYYATNPTIARESINYMLNMDMVGRLSEAKELVINGVGTSPAWKPALEKLDDHGFKLTTTESGVGASDHTSFYLQDIPSVHFFTGAHDDYHKPEDDSHLVNYEGMYDISSYIIDLIELLEDDGKLEFTKTKDDTGRRAARFKVSLGVMPDYTFAEGGMRVDAVLEGRAAEAAGMEAGDVIIQLGDTEVEDMYSYMEALSSFEKGDEATVIFKRGEKEMKKKVKF